MAPVVGCAHKTSLPHSCMIYHHGGLSLGKPGGGQLMHLIVTTHYMRVRGPSWFGSE